MKGPLLVALGVLVAMVVGSRGVTDPEAPKGPQKPKTGRILLLGDSLMVGASIHVLSPHVTLAKVGKTLGEMLAELRDLPAGAFDGVVISGGLNDLAFPSTGDQIAMRASAIWQLARDKGWKVAHFALTPFGGGAYASRLSELERRRANEQMRAISGSVTILPADDALDDPNDSTRLASEFASSDGLHLKPSGYRVLGALVDEWVRTRL